VPDRGTLGYVYSFADLTEIRRLEREVRMRDRLSAVGRMAAGIAHEIRNPLAQSAVDCLRLMTGANVTVPRQERHIMIEFLSTTWATRFTRENFASAITTQRFSSGSASKVSRSPKVMKKKTSLSFSRATQVSAG